MPGYTEDEKLHIAQQFLVPKQLEEHGLSRLQLTFTGGALRKMIREYTREAGVRDLEREIGGICRKVARRFAENHATSARIDVPSLASYLGAQKFYWGAAEESDQVGVATGVARTELGGDVLGVEVTLMPGKGGLTLTGQLGEVMRESAQAALSYARSRAHDLLYLGDRVIVMGAHPGHIRADVMTDLERPRVSDKIKTSPQFVELQAICRRSLHAGTQAAAA